MPSTLPLMASTGQRAKRPENKRPKIAYLSMRVFYVQNISPSSADDVWDLTCTPWFFGSIWWTRPKCRSEEKRNNIKKTLMTEEETAFCSIILLLVIKVYREIITL